MIWSNVRQRRNERQVIQMPSPLFNAFGNQNNQMNDLITRFNKFRQSFNGNPQQQVQQLLNSGRMTQEQFERFRTMAEQMRKFM